MITAVSPNSQLNEKPALLLLGSQMVTGGAQRVLLDQAEWFSAQHYRVTVAFLYDKENLQTAWQKSYPFPILNLRSRRAGSNPLMNSLRLVSGFFRLVRILKAGRFSAIETFTHHANLVGLLAGGLAGVPVRVASHHGQIERFPRLLEKLHARLINSPLCTRMVAVSKRVYQQSLEEGIRADKMVIIPNGVKELVPTADAREKHRLALGLATQDPLILCAGRLSGQKAHTILLQAVPAVLARCPQARFIIAGDGPLMADLQSEIQALGIAAAVHMLGTRTDLPDLMAAADIFVLPSISEGMPMVVLEAMSLGLAVIASRVGGLAEMIEDGADGLLFPAGDRQQLAGSLLRLIEQPFERERLGRAGQVKAARDYGLESTCRQYEHQLFGSNEGISSL